jgi:protein-S-isoprenylcysteine O-methyltransferase Ste14
LPNAVASGPAAPAGDASKRWARVAFAPLLMGVILFGAAGRIDWYSAWFFIALVTLMQVRVIFALERVSPDLLTERSRLQAGSKPWDKIIAPLIAIVLPMLMWLVSGLDLRHSGTPPLTATVQVIGFIVAAVSSELTARAMIANRFFAATVRIQTERGHRVISTGPYAVVRHPGCVGMLGFTLATPLALGSSLAFIPAGLCTVLLIVRTILEDRTLRTELTGYQDYALRVRWRLIPGLW